MAAVAAQVAAGTHEVAGKTEADRRELAAQPPAVQTLAAASVSGSFPAIVWPYGQSAGTARRANETPEEFAEWERSKNEYQAWRDANYPASITPSSEASEWPKPGAEKLTFKELYLEALLNSGKCTRSMREKCIADEEYAEDFSKACLLVNVGRINTTLAFYPEMKTILRSYHPVPSLQHSESTRRHMQDAPRMKSLLKAILLPNERPGAAGITVSAGAKYEEGVDTKEVPNDLAEIARRARTGRPTTSVVTLIFLLTYCAYDINSLHFFPPHDVHSLFFPQQSHPLPAKERASVFLWLLYHYLEGPAGAPPGSPDAANPFDDVVSRAAAADAYKAWMSAGGIALSEAAPLWRGIGEKNEYRITVPALPVVSEEEFASEDKEPEEEIAWGKQMQEERSAFLVRFQEEEQARILAQADDLDEETRARIIAAASGEADKNRKRSASGTQSCYPLANILANAAAAGLNKHGIDRSPIGFVKRARFSSRNMHARDDRDHDEKDTSASVSSASEVAPARPTPTFNPSTEMRSVSLVDHAWNTVRASTEVVYDSDDGDAPDTSLPLKAQRAYLTRILHILRNVREASST
ncbi:RNA helicase [Malassezia cuniculi]|uniref:RNA helicase n=1 Tax=Malassezia cuniculi TaxID=948313 RepID=A0AAF0EVV1_9BASI|nr:RNA helicase [Malassezia cuniculi]